jgi:hypothetical protein
MATGDFNGDGALDLAVGHFQFDELTASWRRGATAARSMVYRCPSRVSSTCAARRPPRRRRCEKGTWLSKTRRPSSTCGRRAPSSSARRTCTSLRWARPARIPPSAPYTTRTIRRGRPGDRAADRRSASPPAWPSRRSAATRRDRRKREEGASGRGRCSRGDESSASSHRRRRSSFRSSRSRDRARARFDYRPPRFSSVSPRCS